MWRFNPDPASTGGAGLEGRKHRVMGLLWWVLLALITVLAGALVFSDPRKMRAVVVSGWALAFWLFTLLLWVLSQLAPAVGDALAYYLLAAFLIQLAAVLVLAVLLIWAGIVLIHREGLSLMHLLSLALGLAMILYPAALFYTDVYAMSAAYFLLALGLPIMVFAWLLVSYLIYSSIYGAVVKRWGLRGEATVVLGTGLVRGKVGPMLASRVNLGVECFQQALPNWERAALVFSGGQGSDEPLPEAEAMRTFALEHHRRLTDLPASAKIFAEDRSTTTWENLELSQKLLRSNGFDGPWTVATSDFHAFRAANMMSRQGIIGNAVGAKTRAYFWASAKLREYVALLVQGKVWTGVTLLITMLPFMWMVFSSVTGL